MEYPLFMKLRYKNHYNKITLTGKQKTKVKKYKNGWTDKSSVTKNGVSVYGQSFKKKPAGSSANAASPGSPGKNKKSSR